MKMFFKYAALTVAIVFGLLAICMLYYTIFESHQYTASNFFYSIMRPLPDEIDNFVGFLCSLMMTASIFLPSIISYVCYSYLSKDD